MKRGGPILALLFALSGFSGLVYEVLWLRELSLLFGNTAQAASTTLAAFFLGLAAGGWYWGRRSATLARPLRTYAWLEWAIAASALPYFLLLPAYHAIYEPLYSFLAEAPRLLTTAKFLLATAILFPPAFFMGGTLPVVGQHLIRRADQLGRTGSLLYALNTLGAALGALCAGFYLPSMLGFAWSYVLAIAVNVLIGAVAYWLPPALGSPAKPSATRKPKRAKASAVVSPPWVLAFFSGFLTLGLEVLWTRMFSQVMQNSVYTFSAILVVFLAVLSLGGFAANYLSRRKLAPETVLLVLLTLAGLGAAVSPFLFMDATNGMGYIGSGLPWGAYVTTVFVRVSLVLLIPGVLIGSVFPYLLRMAQGVGAPGVLLGRMAALNTLGAVAGSIVAGFLILPTFGLWGGLRLFGLAYLLLALLTVGRQPKIPYLLAAAPAAGVILLFTVLDATALPLLRISDKDERLLETWQGSHGVTAVVESRSGLRIKVNNFYRLGGSAASEHEQNQALIPLMSHPGSSGYLVGRSHIQPSAVEVDGVDEVLLIAESASGGLDPLNP